MSKEKKNKNKDAAPKSLSDLPSKHRKELIEAAKKSSEQYCVGDGTKFRLKDYSTEPNFELGKEDAFITLCSHLKSSRILRMLQAIDTIDPGSASKLLMYAEENNDPEHVMAGLFLRRNIVFERLRLLARVFSPDRFIMVQKMLEHEA